jgi:hypothetical protein
MHTNCRLFVLIGSSCADFMNTDSVLCRLFADLIATGGGPSPLSSRAKEQRWRCYDPHRWILHPWAKRPTRAAGGASALLGEAAAAGGGCRPIERSDGGGRRHLRERSAAVSPDVIHPVPPPQAAGAASLCKARRGVTRERAEASGHEGEGGEGLGGMGQGLGARASRRGPRAGFLRPFFHSVEFSIILQKSEWDIFTVLYNSMMKVKQFSNSANYYYV